MRLTGKAKTLLDRWITDSDIRISISAFYLLPESCRWGIIQDWADSMGIEIATEYLWNETYYWRVYTQEDVGSDGVELTRQEARNAAIDKLNELVNGER